MENLYLKQLSGLLEEKNHLAALCNSVAFLKEITPDINWIGYYFFKDNELVLGPFQGKVACTHLSLDKGVCAKAYRENRLTNVKNVHDFPGHIACDSASNSELVIPIIVNNQKVAVLDIDSELIERFGKDEEIFFSEVALMIGNYLSK